jgi:hypothetical protein
MCFSEQTKLEIDEKFQLVAKIQMQCNEYLTLPLVTVFA